MGYYKDYTDDDDDDIDMNEDELAELNMFLDWFKQKEEEYFSEPRIKIINPKRYKEFQYVLFKITKIVKDVNPEAEITYVLNTDANIGNAAIDIETDELIVYNKELRNFISAISLVTNFEIYSLKNGNIRMGMMFHDMFDEISQQTDE